MCEKNYYLIMATQLLNLINLILDMDRRGAHGAIAEGYFNFIYIGLTRARETSEGRNAFSDWHDELIQNISHRLYRLYSIYEEQRDDENLDDAEALNHIHNIIRRLNNEAPIISPYPPMYEDIPAPLYDGLPGYPLEPPAYSV